MLRVGRDGGLQNFELHGLVTLRISDEKMGRIRVQLENKDTRGIQLQVRQYKSVSAQKKKYRELRALVSTFYTQKKLFRR